MIAIPTLTELYTAIINDLESEFGGTINPLGKAVLRAFAGVQAGKLKLYYLVVGRLQKNIAPDTCDEETLLRFGMIKLNRLPFPAVAGQYQIQVTGMIGAVIPAQSTFKSDDTALNPGILYILDNAYTLVSITDYITVRSLTVGLESKLDLGDTLTPTAPIPLVNSNPGSAFVMAEIVQPLAAEPIEEYRATVIQSYRLEAQGGAATDYRIWAQDAQGVAQVYPYARSGYSSEVNLFVEATQADSTDGKGTPSQQILNDVEDVVEFNPDTSLPLNERGRRPVQVVVNYLPVTIMDVQITIANAQGFSPTDKSQILAALTDSVNLVRPFVAAADDIINRNDTLNANIFISVILTTKPGAVFGAVTFTVNGIASTSYQFGQGDIPYLNQTILYV